MLKEGAYAEAEEDSQESIEHRGGFPKETLKRLVESHHLPTDSGRSALLFRIPKEELSPEEQGVMFDPGGDNNPEGSLSIKALKVLNLAGAREEFKALQEARKIINEKIQSSSTPILRIPRAMGFDEIEVDKETQDRLNANGASITNGKVGIITMDWIEGKDLGAVLHEELLKRLPEGEDPYEGDLWDNPDFDDLFRALEKTDFVIPEEVLAQLKNGVNAWHEGGLYHNDLHPRNIIVKDGRLENAQLWGIDFADAGHEKRNIEEAEGPFYLSDEKIIRSLSRLTLTPEMKRKAKDEAEKKEWNDRITLLEQQPKAQEQYKSLKGALAGKNSNMLEGQLIAASGSDRDLENYLGNLLRLSRENDEYHDQIKNFLDRCLSDNRKSKIRSFVLNRIQAFQKAIEI
jgi:hypothetical protein